MNLRSKFRMFRLFLRSRRRLVLVVGLAVLDPLRGVAEDGRVTITAKQAAYLRSQAKGVRQNLGKLTKKLSKWDKDPGVEIGNLGEPEPEGTLGDGIRKAVLAATSTYKHFVALSVSQQQKVAAQVFFEDILTRYSRLSESARLAPSCHFDCYPRVRSEAIQALELNALAYETVAEAGSETFDLCIESTPPGAMILYKREADDYRKHLEPTNTSIRNLVYAVWFVRVHKDGLKDQEKKYNPFTEKTPLIRFDLTASP